MTRMSDDKNIFRSDFFLIQIYTYIAPFVPGIQINRILLGQYIARNWQYIAAAQQYIDLYPCFVYPPNDF